MSILERIVEAKKARLEKLGATLGNPVPNRRKTPLVSFGTPPLLICEIKRGSPSRGAIDMTLNPITQVAKYRQRGIRTVSILTEEQYFSGSLKDLIAVKTRFPDMCVLRKDFILTEDEIDVSFLAGADAVLLIASLHPLKQLKKLYHRAQKYSMGVLFEVHSNEDLTKASQIKPMVTGFNSRNLTNFTIDRVHPLLLKNRVDWPTITIFESGIRAREDALFVLSSGFSGMLIGESVVKNPELIIDILPLYKQKIPEFWQKLYATHKRPLVKICGVTNRKDALYLKKKGTDILGFVFAPSPRRASFDILKDCGDIHVLKVGVITPASLEETETIKHIKDLFEDNLLDALQLHGFPPPMVSSIVSLTGQFPFYHAVRIADRRDLQKIFLYHSPRILLDTYVRGVEGGTGRQMPESIITRAKKHIPLWLAGGIGPHNVGRIVKQFNPELIDASSMLEKSKGTKDPTKIDTFFKEIKRAKNIQ